MFGTVKDVTDSNVFLLKLKKAQMRKVIKISRHLVCTNQKSTLINKKISYTNNFEGVWAGANRSLCC